MRIGENRVQEAATKIPALPKEAEWHLIGPLQSNKVRQALDLFRTIHSSRESVLGDFVAGVHFEEGVADDAAAGGFGVEGQGDLFPGADPDPIPLGESRADGSWSPRPA
jgi:hypothetical protein